MSAGPSQSQEETEALKKVSRTRSGLPLCPTCRVELGFCEHSAPNRGSRVGGRSGTSALSETKVLGGVQHLEAVSEDDAQEDDRRSPSSPSRKRRQGRNRQSSRRGKRRSGTRRKRGNSRPRPRRSRRSASQRGDNPGVDWLGGEGPEHGHSAQHVRRIDSLLRLPGFARNTDEHTCLACYCAEDIFVSFGCKGSERSAPTPAQEGSSTAWGLATESSSSSDEEDSAGDASDLHVMCIDCFTTYLKSRVDDRKFMTNHKFDRYTVGCPMGCADSCIDPACFKSILRPDQMTRYRRFCALHLATDMRIIWCPECECGIVPTATKDPAEDTTEEETGTTESVALRNQTLEHSPWGWGWWWRRWRWWWGGSTVNDGAGRTTWMKGVEIAETTPPSPRQSTCITCPGCNAVVCTACRGAHEPDAECNNEHAPTAHDWCGDSGENRESSGGVHQQGGGGGDENYSVEKQEIGTGESSASGSTISGGIADGAGARAASKTGEWSQGGLETMKRCPNCHALIFKDGGCNHMICGMCRYEFCWVHLTKWEVGGPCQRGHWSSDPMLNSAYNAHQAATTAAASLTSSCLIS